jgi:hypothetical protein
MGSGERNFAILGGDGMLADPRLRALAIEMNAALPPHRAIRVSSALAAPSWR